MKTFTKRTAAALCSAAVAISASSVGTIASAFAEKQAAMSAVSQPALSLSVPELSYTAVKAAEMPEPVAAYAPITSDIELYADSAGLPSKYDMRDTYGIMPIRIQSPYGTCWAHSAVASAETSLLQSVPDIDLSELHTAFYTYFGSDQLDSGYEDIKDILNVGGNSRMVMNLWAQWIGPVLESTVPYDDLSVFDDPDNAYYMKSLSNYHLKNAYEFDFDEDRSNFDYINSLVKQFVLSGEAVDISFMSDAEQNYSFEYSSSNSKRKPRFADHSVAVVGWDDSFPAAHFRNSPEGDGAWLCKNSWGTLSGEDGYIWVSYYDRSLSEFTVFELDDIINNSTEIFQHDSFIPIQTMSAHDSAEINEPSYMANIFQSYYDVVIDSVGTYIYNPGTEYEITVYTGLTDENDPTSGTPSGVTYGSCDMTGFLTLDLDKSVVVPEQESFGVVVKLYCPDTPFVIPFESAIYAEDEDGEIFDIGSYSTCESVDLNTYRAESFFSSDGVNWTDMVDSDFTYSDEDKEYLLESFIQQLYDGLEPEDTELIEGADATAELFEMLFELSDIKVKMGNVSLKAYGNMYETIKFSHPQGEVPLNEAVELTAANGEPIKYIVYHEYDFGVSEKDALIYNEPIKITEPVVIYAWTGDNEWSGCRYIPKPAGFTFIGYETTSPEYDSELRYAEKIAPNEYVIRITPDKDHVRLYPGTPCNITMNGSPCEAYRLTEEISADFGVTDVVFSLSGENVLDNEITVHIERLPVEFDLENETVIYPDYESVYAPDGTLIPSGAYVGDLAGQTLTVKMDGETIEAAVPERHDVSGLEIDFGGEYLGSMTHETAELLEYAVISGTQPEDFISALSGRVIGILTETGEGTGNWGFTVIPGETVTLKVRAGSGKFASETCTYVIPAAPEAPTEMPGYSINDENCIIFDGDVMYQLAEASEPYELNFYIVGEAMGYEQDTGLFRKLMEERYGMGKDEELYSIEFSYFAVEQEYFTGDGYLRYAATDTQFSSKALKVVIPPRGDITYEPGDVNRDGFVDAVDASEVLAHYASISTNGDSLLDSVQEELADINSDGLIDAVDASVILAIYADRSTVH